MTTEKEQPKPRQRRRAKGDASYRQRPDGSWEGRISINYRPYSRYGKTRAEAKAKIDELVKNLKDGVIPSNAPLSKWADHWLEKIIKPKRSAATYALYETIARIHIKPKLGRIRLNKITEPEVQAFLDAKRVEKKDRQTKR